MSTRSEAQPEQAIARVEGGRAGGARVSLAGPLRPGWAGNLCAGLARAGIDIARGFALRSDEDGTWSAGFDLAPTAGGEDPAGVDYVALAHRDAGAGFTTPLVIRGWEMRAVPEHGGALLLSVEADDAVGFLAALLRRLAFFSLFPVELRLDTRRGRVSDRLWLRSAGGLVPSERTRGALAESLARMRRDDPAAAS